MVVTLQKAYHTHNICLLRQLSALKQPEALNSFAIDNYPAVSKRSDLLGTVPTYIHTYVSRSVIRTYSIISAHMERNHSNQTIWQVSAASFNFVVHSLLTYLVETGRTLQRRGMGRHRNHGPSRPDRSHC